MNPLLPNAAITLIIAGAVLAAVAVILADLWKRDEACYPMDQCATCRKRCGCFSDCECFTCQVTNGSKWEPKS